MVDVSRAEALNCRKVIKVEAREAAHKYEEYKHMPIAINFVSSRRKKIAVDVVPAEWQTYIAQ